MPTSGACAEICNFCTALCWIWGPGLWTGKLLGQVATQAMPRARLPSSDAELPGNAGLMLSDCVYVSSRPSVFEGLGPSPYRQFSTTDLQILLLSCRPFACTSDYRRYEPWNESRLKSPFKSPCLRFRVSGLGATA